MGIVKLNTEPLLGVDSATIWLPCPEITRLQIAKPIPSPESSVLLCKRWNMVNIFFKYCCSIPMPLSLIKKRQVLATFLAVLEIRSGLTDERNFIAFAMRCWNTMPSCVGSACISGRSPIFTVAPDSLNRQFQCGQGFSNYQVWVARNQIVITHSYARVSWQLVWKNCIRFTPSTEYSI